MGLFCISSGDPSSTMAGCRFRARLLLGKRQIGHVRTDGKRRREPRRVDAVERDIALMPGFRRALDDEVARRFAGGFGPRSDAGIAGKAPSQRRASGISRLDVLSLSDQSELVHKE